MSYEYITQYTTPKYWPGRPAGTPQFIVVHHWGNDGQKFDGVINFFVNSPTQTSAHYVVEAGRVACIVDPDDRAWHAGSLYGNNLGIGIECHPECTEGDRATLAELIADIRRVYGNIPLRMHNEFTATACPGRYAKYLAEIDRMASGILGTEPAVNTLTQTPNIDALADAVIRGEYGTGAQRKARLGAIYDTVQARVNEKINAQRQSQTVNISALADAVIRGEYGTGAQRKARLGAIYGQVQAEVNRRLLR